jgi:Na+-driven multidrug efflux pump
VLYLIGKFYLSSFYSDSTHSFAWNIYLIGFVNNLFSSLFSVKLKAHNKISLNNLIEIISRFLYISLSIFLSLNGFGLLGLAIAFFIKSALLFIALLISNNLIFLKGKPLGLKFFYRVKNFTSTLKHFMPPIFKQILNNLSGWLINKGVLLVLVSFLTVSEFNSFSLTLQIFGLLTTFSALLFDNLSPRIASALKSNDDKTALSLFSRSIIFSYIVEFLGSLTLIFFGGFLLQLLNNELELNLIIIIIYSIFSFFELNQAVFSGFIALSNKFPFVPSSIISGILVVFLAFLGLVFMNFGLIEILILQFFIQALYNFWKWPKFIISKYKTSFIKILKEGFLGLFSFLF